MFSQGILFVLIASVAVVSAFEYEHHAPQPYKFGYNIKDKHGEQYRQEEGNGGHSVKGSYGFTDSRGVKRQVDYVADHAGFRAQVKTNEPGTANQNPAAVKMISDAPYAGGVGLGYGGYGGYGYGNDGYGDGGYGYGNDGYGNGGYGYGNDGYGDGGYGYGNDGYGYGGSGYGNAGYGNGYGYGMPYGLNAGLLGGLGYARYGY